MMTGEARFISAAEQLLRERKLEKALAMFDQSERHGAGANQCAAGRWTIHMLLAGFEQAWRESDAIRRSGSADPHSMWQGESLTGKRIIVRSLHGFGDSVQFLCYMTQLQEIAERVILEVPPRFVEIATCFDGVDEVITWGLGAPMHQPEWDVQIEIMELPYLFRTQVSDLPVATRYLNRPAQSNLSQVRCSDSLQIGLVWTAGEWNTARSISFSILKPLFDLKGCEFWNLQSSDCDSEDDVLLEDDSCRDSIIGLAARIARLDLVITVDTLAAHLAGAMGIAAWVLLQHEADWRWMHDRTDSPWYPSLRLFRQAEPGDWLGVIGSVSEALHTLVRSTLDQKRVA